MSVLLERWSERNPTQEDEAPHKGYIAAVISKRAAKKLRARAIHPKVYCHHITMAYAPDDATYAKYASLIGRTIAFSISGVYSNRKGQAARVEGVPSQNKRPHITLSCAPGVAPVYSNTLLARKKNVCKSRYRQRGFAKVEFIPF